MAFPDPEIGLHRSDADSYRVELCFSQSESGAEPVDDWRQQGTSWADFGETLRTITLEA